MGILAGPAKDRIDFSQQFLCFAEASGCGFFTKCGLGFVEHRLRSIKAALDRAEPIYNGVRLLSGEIWARL